MTSSEEDYILRSITNRALSLEVRVADKLRALGWNTSHSAFFRDVREQKDREIDVSAIRYWSRRRKKRSDSVHLHLLAECKTVEDGKLLFAPLPPSEEEQRPYRQWADLDDYAIRARFFDMLTTAGLEQEQAARVLSRVHANSYPKGESIFGDALQVLAPSVPLRVSAGREVMSKRERSPLYDATQALYATIDGTANELFTFSIEEVRDRVVSAGSVRRKISEAVAAATNETTTLALFHPVVVTDSKLWLRQDGADPIEITSCRILQSRIVTEVVRWVDVVHESAFAAYAEQVSRWYEEQLADAGCVARTAPGS